MPALGRSLEEIEWRFNNRENPPIFRDTLRKILDTETLTFEELIVWRPENTRRGLAWCQS